jgi:hypothetical protein
MSEVPTSASGRPVANAVAVMDGALGAVKVNQP